MLFYYTIASLRAKRDVFATLLMFLVSAVLFAGWFSINRQRLYLSGFNNYAKNVLTPEEWRSISRFAQRSMQPGDHLWGPAKTRQNDNERLLWSEFSNQTQIRKLGGYVMISVQTQDQKPGPYFPIPESTEIEWGGALEGHRGVVIYSNTNEISKPDGALSPPLFFAPDIATYMTF